MVVGVIGAEVVERTDELRPRRVRRERLVPVMISPNRLIVLSDIFTRPPE
jgi:hypothetical protein